MINRRSSLTVFVARSMQTLPANGAQAFLQRVHLVPLLGGDAEAGELVGAASHLLCSKASNESTVLRVSIVDSLPRVPSVVGEPLG